MEPSTVSLFSYFHSFAFFDLKVLDKVKDKD